MSIEEEARAAATERYDLDRELPTNHAHNDRALLANGFVEGYVAGATRPPSETEVEAVLKVLADEDFLPVNARGEEHYPGYYADVVRLALEAARTARGDQS